MEQRLMILGSMDEFIELVNKAKRRGIYTVVCDGYPDGPAKKYADKAYDIDIRRVDEIVEVCRAEKLNGIIASFSDILFEYLVKIAEKAGLKTYCTSEKSVFLRAKSEMKKMFDELEIPTPKSRKIHRGFKEEEIKDFSYPVVIKPVNGYGSRGIYIVDSIEEIRKLFDRVSQYSTYPDDILIESYNDGLEFNMMNWMADGEVYTLGLADREKSVEIKGDIPHVSRVCYPSRVIDVVYEEARRIIKKVADYTGIQTGPLSMQFFYKAGQGIEVCECAGRLFGYEHELVTYGSGFDIEELLLDYVYDEERMKEKLKVHDAHFPKHSAGLYFHGYEGKVCDFSEAVKVIKDIHPVQQMLYYKKGEVVGHGIGAKPYLARLYLQAETREEIDQLSQEAFEDFKVIGENGQNLVYHNQIPDYYETVEKQLRER